MILLLISGGKMKPFDPNENTDSDLRYSGDSVPAPAVCSSSLIALVIRLCLVDLCLAANELLLTSRLVTCRLCFNSRSCRAAARSSSRVYSAPKLIRPVRLYNSLIEVSILSTRCRVALVEIFTRRFDFFDQLRKTGLVGHGRAPKWAALPDAQRETAALMMTAVALLLPI